LQRALPVSYRDACARVDVQIGREFERASSAAGAGVGAGAGAGSASGQGKGQDKGTAGDGDEGFEPINVELNLVKNLLESYSSQHGLPGPVSNILGPLGVSLPDNADRASGLSSQGKGQARAAAATAPAPKRGRGR
jgi:hypothetical protein